MSIASTELVWRAAALTSDTTPAQNGGRMGSAAMPDNTANNLFPNVTQAQRIAGITTLRKDYLHIASADNIALIAPKIYINAATPGADWVTFSPGTQTDTAATHSATHYGTATLTASIAAGATSLSLTPENIASATAQTPWRVGQLIRISDEPYNADSAATTWATIDTVAYAADRVNITLAAPGAAFAHAAGTHVAGVYTPPDIIASATTPTVTSAAGTCTAAQPSNKGSIQQAWTLTFTSATAYTIAGDTVGTLAPTGSRDSTTAPVNPATSAPYFTLPTTAFGGTFTAGNTITFTTAPAAVPLWWHRTVPPACPSLSGNVFSRAATGESA